MYNEVGDKMYIEALDHKGRGIAKIDGKIVFIENALPGEDVDIIISKRKKNYDEGYVSIFNEKSENREKPKCPYYLKCGGCQLMHMSYQNQLSFKQNKINNIIKRYLNKKVPINPIIYANQYHYRNKIRLQVQNKIGLYKKQTNEIVPIDQCLICDSIINDKIKKLNKLNLTSIKDITIRVSDLENMVSIVSNQDIDIQPIYDIFDNIIVNKKLKKGNRYIKVEINNIKYQISSESFFQVNFDIMQKMYDCIKKLVFGSNKVLDLYCGIGSISLYIKDVVLKVDGVEINRQAIKDADNNKRLNDCQNVFFTCSDTKDIMIEDDYDTIIVDPPRSGLNKSIINELLNANCQQIIYVSCDPLTLVRDLKNLNTKYDIVSITPFDMFPNTYHVECVCLLKLK